MFHIEKDVRLHDMYITNEFMEVLSQRNLREETTLFEFLPINWKTDTERTNIQ